MIVTGLIKKSQGIAGGTMDGQGKTVFSEVVTQIECL